MANLKTQGLKPGLLRQLGFFSATALVISNMVGTGIFATTGFMAGDINAVGTAFEQIKSEILRLSQ